MKLSNALLGALLLGIAVETSSCNKADDKKVTPSQTTDDTKPQNQPMPQDNCPACGMG